MLLNFTPVIQQNCHQLGRNFEKSFCGVNRLSCQNPKPGNSEAILFLIINYVHVICLHGANCRFEILSYLKSSDFCVAEILWTSNVPESSRCWQHHYYQVVSHFARHTMWYICIDSLRVFKNCQVKMDCECWNTQQITNFKWDQILSWIYAVISYNMS